MLGGVLQSPKVLFLSYNMLFLLGWLFFKKHDLNRALNPLLSDGCISPYSEQFLVHVVSSPVSHLTSSHACWHFDLFQMQLSCCPHYASRPLHPLWQHCRPGEAHGLPDCPEQPGIPSLVSLRGLQCCSHCLLFSRTTFLDYACPQVTKHELALLQPSHCSWQMDRHSPGPPAVHPPFNYCILS